MPVKIQNDLPAKEVLEHENIFVMDENRAISQDVRPLQILVLNLMPIKEDTELQLLRAMSNTPLQIDVSFMQMEKHVSKNTSESHLHKFYDCFKNLKGNNYDGLIITGAPVEQLEYEDVDYWDELTQIMDWSDGHCTSTLHICWGAQAGLYHRYGIKKHLLDKKLSGIYEHYVLNRKHPLVRGFDDCFKAPHSRYTAVSEEDVAAQGQLEILASSREAGAYLIASRDGRHIFVMGHPEYDRVTLDTEYKRDVKKGINPDIPVNYYPGDDCTQRPLLSWRSHCNILYSNWLNYFVYQTTPYDLNGAPMKR
jgi:homoserine O-succinyltransferase